MRLLLHICCGPCSIYPIERLRHKGIDVTGFFYNPNIQPHQEYARRYEALMEVSRVYNLETIYHLYDPERYMELAGSLKQKELRCKACYQVRLEETAIYAKACGYDAFSTTLLISPYQYHDTLRAVGEHMGEVFGVKFYYEDFRPGFKEGQEKAKELGIYRQRYCGCNFSLEEASAKSRRVKL